MLNETTRAKLRLWLRLLAATNEMERAVRRSLRARFGTTLARFDVMAALERAPDGLSMSELSRSLMVSNGNTTVLVDTLEREALVVRRVSETDRRSFTVQLTERGRSAFAEMAAAHAAWVGELLRDVGPETTEALSQELYVLRLAVAGRAQSLLVGSAGGTR